MVEYTPPAAIHTFGSLLPSYAVCCMYLESTSWSGPAHTPHENQCYIADAEMVMNRTKSDVLHLHI